MKKIIILIYGLVLVIDTEALCQILTPAKWSYSVSSTEVKIGDEVELIFTAKLDPTWYIYSSDQDPDVGPWPAVFEFEPNESFELVGDIMPIGVKEKYDKIWKGKVRTIDKKAEFRQKINILKSNPEIFVTVEYQVCTTVDGLCIPGDEEFGIIDINANK